MRYFKIFGEIQDNQHLVDAELEVASSFNIFDWATFLSVMSSLLAGLLATAVIKSKYHKKISVQGNEGGRVQSNSNVGEIGQSPTEAQISLINNHGYLKMK